MKAPLTLILLCISNVFMTLAWYGHLKFKQYPWFQSMSLLGVILLSWGLAFFEYLAQVPANRLGYAGNGGPFNLWQLKVIQEAITLVIFTIFAVFFFKQETFKWNHAVAFLLLLGAVYFIFKK
jgi:uncharacterized protein (DUF486 family)